MNALHQIGRFRRQLLTSSMRSCSGSYQSIHSCTVLTFKVGAPSVNPDSGLLRLGYRRVRRRNSRRIQHPRQDRRYFLDAYTGRCASIPQWTVDRFVSSIQPPKSPVDRAIIAAGP
jgi:hypothetical protein